MQWGHLIMGECRCAAASLWLGHAPSISLAIGPRHSILNILNDYCFIITTYGTIFVMSCQHFVRLVGFF